MPCVQPLKKKKMQIPGPHIQRHGFTKSRVRTRNLFFFFPLIFSHLWSSWARDQIQAAAMATSILNPLGWAGGLNLNPSTPEMPLIPLRHSRNSLGICIFNELPRVF